MMWLLNFTSIKKLINRKVMYGFRSGNYILTYSLTRILEEN